MTERTVFELAHHAIKTEFRASVAHARRKEPSPISIHPSFASSVRVQGFLALVMQPAKNLEQRSQRALSIMIRRDSPERVSKIRPPVYGLAWCRILASGGYVSRGCLNHSFVSFLLCCFGEESLWSPLLDKSTVRSIQRP